MITSLKPVLSLAGLMLVTYLAYLEIWLPVNEMREKYARFKRIPRKSRRDHARFWLYGKMPAAGAPVDDRLSA